LDHRLSVKWHQLPGSHQGHKSAERPEAEIFAQPERMFSYPDLLVVCGEMRFHDEHGDVLTNPTVIIEVLSKSTEKFDHREKFFRYQTWNPTLTDYLIVSQNEPLIGHYVRQSDGSWLFNFYFDLDQSLMIDSIGCTLPLAKVYERASFPSEEPEENEENEENDDEE
jgi:Uma2 family endonuclease